MTLSIIDRAASYAHRNPSEAQKNSGNYRKGHVKFQGLDIAIENARGSMRQGTGPDGEAWSVKMPSHYGYIKRTEGAAQDHIDVYIGPHHKSPHVFVIDQVDADDGKYDEHKVMLGFGSKKQAETTYCAGFSDGKGKCRIGHIAEMSMDEFKDWLKSEDTTEPIRGKYARGGVVKKITENEKHKRHSWDARSRGPWDRRSRKAEGGRVGDDYNTTLSDVDEATFQIWKRQNMPQDSGVDYDQRGAYQAQLEQQANGHWQDAFKKPNHPTFSDQSRYAVQQPDLAGHWNGDQFIPPVLKAGGGPVDDWVNPVTDDWVTPTKAPADTSISGRLKNMWDKATPGGPLWMAKQAIEGAQGAVQGSADAMSEPTTEEGAYFQNQGREKGPGAAMQAAQFLTPAAPKGTGGLFAAPVRSAAEAVAPVAAANREAASEFGINLSKGQSTQDLDRIRYEDMAARGAYGKEAQDRAATFFQKQFEDTQAAGQSVGQQTARAAPVVDSPGEAASVLNADVGERAAGARALLSDAERAATTEAEAQRGIVADQGRAIDETIRGRALPIENPREAGEIVGQNVRDAAAANRADFRARYDEFGSLPGEFRADAVKGMGDRVRNELTYGENPVVIDDLLTPSASRAVQALDQMSIPRIQNRASPHADPSPGEVAAVSLKGVDQMRKQLVAYYQAARSSGNAADIRATREVMNGFDGQIERALTEGLFSGDPRALAALQEARASYSRYQRTFTPQGAGDDVGIAMRRIVDRNATPEEISNMIVGSGKIGNAGLPVRIADRLEQVLGADSDSWSAIRQAMWQKASQARTSAGEIDPVKSANNIAEFAGSSLAQRMFTGQERQAMRAHAQGVRDLDRVVEALPATERANQARNAYQEVFGAEGLAGTPAAAFKRIVEGVATPEETANAMFKAIGAGNPGNATRALKAIERIVGPDSETMAAVRQGVWQKLTQAAAGKDQPGAQKAMQAINEFLNGTGKTIAEQLYSEKELALMARYANTLKLTIIPKYARTNSDTAPALLAAVRKYGAAVMGALGYAHGDGGLTGMGVGKLLEMGANKLEGVGQRKRLNDSLDDIIPKPRSLLGNREMPSRVIRKAAPLVFGPRSPGIIPAGAEDENVKAKRMGQ